MKPQIFSRKIRQFKTACKELETQINSGKSTDSPLLVSLLARIKKLARELAQAFNWGYVKTAMGSAAFLFGMVFSNQSTAQHFLPPVENPFSLEPAYNFAFPALADLDGDGDYDLLVFEYYGAAQYYENTGSPTLAVFGTPIPNAFGIGDAYYIGSPTFADIDNDGDMDLFVGEYYGNLQFYENVGTPSAPDFSPAVENPFGYSPQPDSYFISPTLADLDDDGDLDLLVANVGYNNPEMIYFANEGTVESPLLGKPNPSPYGLTTEVYIAIPQLIDLDQDGDFDLMSGNSEGTFIFQENIGTASQPDMAAPVINLFNLDNTYYISALAFADMDDDGDLDLLVGEYYGNFQYFENAPELSVNEINEPLEVSVFPNPSSDYITVKSSENISKIEIIDILGRTNALVNDVNGNINISFLEAGNYLLKVTMNSGKTGITKFIKQ